MAERGVEIRDPRHRLYDGEPVTWNELKSWQKAHRRPADHIRFELERLLRLGRVVAQLELPTIDGHTLSTQNIWNYPGEVWWSLPHRRNGMEVEQEGVIANNGNHPLSQLTYSMGWLK